MILDFVALAFIACTVSLPIGSIGLAISVIFAHFLLHESFKTLDFVGTLAVIAGAWFIVGFSTKTMELLTIEIIRQMFRGTELYFFIVLASTFILTLILSYCVKNALLYSLVPGLCGSFTIMFGGMIGQCTLNTLKGNNQMIHWEYYLLVLGLVSALLILNNYLQRALNAFDNMIVTPVFFTSILIISVLSGIFFFKYFNKITVVQGAMFGVGIGLIVVGCVFLCVNHIGQNGVQFNKLLVQKEDFQVIDVVQTLKLEEQIQ